MSKICKGCGLPITVSADGRYCVNKILRFPDIEPSICGYSKERNKGGRPTKTKYTCRCGKPVYCRGRCKECWEKIRLNRAKVIKPYKITHHIKRKIDEMRKGNYTLKEIAAELSISASTVSKYV